jgi:hypothetical protein
MDALGSWSDTTFAAPKPYDPGADKSFLETAFSGGTHGIGEVYDAAKSAAELTSGALTLRDVRSNIYDDLSRQVKAATGVELDNPTAIGQAQAPNIAELVRQRTASGLGADGAIPDFMAQRERDLMDQVRALKQQQPGKMLGVDVDTPIEDRMKQRFSASADALARAKDDTGLNPILRFGAETLGSMVGSRGDPLFWASFALPAGGFGANVATRIGTAALLQGGGMAALSATQQPAQQALREKVGLAPNAGEQILEAGLGGALIGGGLRGAHEMLAPIIQRIIGGSAKPADYAAAAEAGVHVDEPTQQAIAQEAEAVRAHSETFSHPDTVPDQTASTAFFEGLSHAENPDAPPPLVDRSVPKGTTDALARELVDKTQSPGEAIDALKAHDLNYEPAVYDQKISERARALAPDTFTAADVLDSRIASLRGQIAEAVNGPPPAAPANGRVDLLQGQLSGVQRQLDAITGKRRSSPRAIALREQAAALGDEIAAARAEAANALAANAALAQDRIQAMRLHLNDTISDRARMGPEIAAARAAAEREAALLGVKRGAIESALASDDPHLRDLGRLASLGDDALKIVRQGEVEPVHGAIVAGTTLDEAKQAQLLSVIKEAKPESVEEARQVVTEHLAAEAAPEAAVARMGAPAPIKRTMPKRAELSLLETLAWHGLAPNEDLRRIFDGNPFVPGFGRLFRKSGGLPLDHAFDLAKDRGYLHDPADYAGGTATLRHNDLFDLMAKEARGQKQWPIGYVPPVKVDKTAERLFAKELKALRKTIGKHVGTPDGGALDDAILGDAAVRMHLGEHTDPVAAWDAAAVAYERDVMSNSARVDAAYEARIHDTGPIPGFDFPEVSADARPAPQPGEGLAQGSREEPGSGGVPAGSGEQARQYGGPDPMAAGLQAGDAGMIDRIPVVREDGTTGFMRRDDIARAAERERWMSDVIKACKD